MTIDSSQIQQPSETVLQIHPDAFVHVEAKLNGSIKIGAGTIIHPKCVIDAGAGSIEFGTNNIVEEGVLIKNNGDPDTVMNIGNDNTFEVNSVCHSLSVGNHNVFGIRSVVGEKVIVSNGCRIGSKCQVLAQTQFPERSVIQFDNTASYIASEMPSDLDAQTAYLKKILTKYSFGLQNKKQ